HYRGRYYDLNRGRFLSEDPLRFLADTNFYGYVRNNPVLFIDPSGYATVVNNTGKPILVSGDAGTGTIHGGGGGQMYGVIPSDGQIYGGDQRPVPVYPSIPEALDAFFGPRPPKPPTAEVVDIDFYDPTGLEPNTPANSLKCDKKMDGDKFGPKHTFTYE